MSEKPGGPEWFESDADSFDFPGSVGIDSGHQGVDQFGHIGIDSSCQQSGGHACVARSRGLRCTVRTRSGAKER